MKKEIELKDVLVGMDENSGKLYLKSKDRRIKGEPFKLTLSSQGESYQTLYNLFKREYPRLADDYELPVHLNFNGPEDTQVPGKHPEYNIRVGMGAREKWLDLDLLFSPNHLIAGYTGGGKSVLQRNIIAHGLAHKNVLVYGIDLKRVELQPYRVRAQDRFATDSYEAVQLLLELKKLVEKRCAARVKESDPMVYLVIDEIGQLLGYRTPQSSLEKSESDYIKQLLLYILEHAREAKVATFLASQRPDCLSEVQGLAPSIGTRIRAGHGNVDTDKLLFREPQQFAKAHFEPRGRAIIELYGEQKLFHVGFMAQESVTASD